jgi:hypothetical protein
MEFNLNDAQAVLARTPAVLQTWLSDLQSAWAESNDGAETWSPYDVIGHLLHGERTDWIPRAQIILQHGEAQPFPPFDRFAQFNESKGKTLAELLKEFAALRSQNLRTLRNLNISAADLQKTGTHPAFGQVTLEQLLATWVAHDLGHLAQIARTMARQYTRAVGPWHAYLTILHDHTQ